MRSIATTALFACFLAFAPVSYTTAAALSPKCTGMSKGAECWNELTNRPGCYIFDPYYDPPETATWSGVCVGGVAVGQGTWEWETANNSGESTGMLDDDGMMHGRWIERWADGNVSEGPYSDGKRQGHWVRRQADGFTGEGSYVDGKRHGHWVWSKVDGTTHKGPYLDGKRHGYWVLRDDDGTVWQGLYVDDDRQGQWIMFQADGTTGSGLYVDGKMDVGHGVHWADEKVSEVFFVYGNAQDRNYLGAGQAARERQRAAEEAAQPAPDPVRRIQEALAGAGFDPGPVEGEFGPRTRRAIEGWQQANGHAVTGELTDAQVEALLAAAPTRPFGPNWSIVENQPCQVWNYGMPEKLKPFTWSGPCIDGKVSGEGRLTVSRIGASYQGSMADGKFHRHGTMTWANGDRYEGEWRDSKPHGHGTYTRADGSRYEGEWRAGCFEQDGRRLRIGTTKEACGFE